MNTLSESYPSREMEKYAYRFYHFASPQSIDYAAVTAGHYRLDGANQHSRIKTESLVTLPKSILADIHITGSVTDSFIAG